MDDVTIKEEPVEELQCEEEKLFTSSTNQALDKVTYTGVRESQYFENKEVCERKFEILPDNVSSTAKERKFECLECGKPFYHKGSLKRHSQIHTGVKLFKCDACNKLFTQKISLTKHSLIHTGIKRFKCDECGKLFIQKSHLVKHSLIHTGITEFKCDECGKRFTHRSTLNQHSLTHTGVKQFKCNECEKLFSLKTNLVRHINTLHNHALPCSSDQ